MCKLEVEKLHQKPQYLSYHQHSGKDRYNEDEVFHDAKDSFEAVEDPYQTAYNRRNPEHSYQHSPMLRAGSSSSSSRASHTGSASGSHTTLVSADQQKNRFPQQHQSQREGEDRHGSLYPSNDRFLNDHLKPAFGTANNYGHDSSSHVSEVGKRSYESSRELMTTHNDAPDAKWSSKDKGLRFASDYRSEQERNDTSVGFDTGRLDGTSTRTSVGVPLVRHQPVAPPRRGHSTSSDLSSPTYSSTSSVDEANAVFSSVAVEGPIHPAPSITSSSSNMHASVSSSGFQAPGARPGPSK